MDNNTLNNRILNSFKTIFKAMNITQDDIVTKMRELRLPELSASVRQQLYVEGYDLEDGLSSKDLDISQPAEIFKFKQRYGLVYLREQFLSVEDYRRGFFGKFHICYCDALKRAKEQNRYVGRYILTLNTEGIFRVNLSVRDYNRTGKVYTDKKEQGVFKRLNVCQECLRQVNWKNFRKYCGTGLYWYKFGDKGARQRIVNSFNIKEFIAQAEALDFESFEDIGTDISTQATEYDLSPEIKQKMKELKGFCCEVCGKQYPKEFLEVHHIGHTTGNNRFANLQVVCKYCHDIIHGDEGGLRNKDQQYEQTLVPNGNVLAKNKKSPSITFANGMKVSADILAMVLTDRDKNSDCNSAWLSVLHAYKQAEETDSVVALYKLGKLYANPKFFQYDPKEANKYFEECYDELSKRAQSGDMLAKLYKADILTNQNNDQAQASKLVEMLISSFYNHPKKFGPEACLLLASLINDDKKSYEIKSKALGLYKFYADTDDKDVAIDKKEAAYIVSRLTKELTAANGAKQEVKYWRKQLQTQGDILLAGSTTSTKKLINKHRKEDTLLADGIISTNELINKHRKGDKSCEIYLYSKLMQGDREALVYYLMCADAKSEQYLNIINDTVKIPDSCQATVYYNDRCLTNCGDTNIYDVVLSASGTISVSTKAIRRIRYLNAYTVSYNKSFLGIEEVVLPNSATEIGDNTFAKFSKLKSVEMPHGLTKIGRNAFNGCSSLQSITIPDSVKDIGRGAFENCTSLENVNLSRNITVIKQNLFEGCESLSSIIIPERVRTIGECAFAYCRKLQDITVPNGVTIIQSQTFFCCNNLKSITIPDRLTRIDYEAFAFCSSMTSITIPKGVTEIRQGAFLNCYSLTSITIPDSVKEIGPWAFHSCSSLTSITIPNSVKEIGKEAFSNCSSLTSIKLPTRFKFKGYKYLGLEGTNAKVEFY